VGASLASTADSTRCRYHYRVRGLRDMATELIEQIERLQAKYDELTAKRGKLIKIYDGLWDGDPQKGWILHRMDMIGRQIRAYEDRIGKLVDEYLQL